MSIWTQHLQAEQAAPLRMCAVLNDRGGEPAVLGWLDRQDWPWGVEVNHSASSDTVRTLASKKLKVVVCLRAHPQWRAAKAHRKNQPVADPATELKRMLDAAGPGLTWLAVLEDDSAGGAFPQRLLQAKPESHAEAKRLFDEYLDEALRPLPGIPPMERLGVCGYASGAHRLAAHGVDCVLIERANDDVEDLQTGIACARGAARQYGKAWGVDLSLWWGAIHASVQDLPASLYRRHLFLSFFSGARTFRIEGADLLARANPSEETPLNHELARFHQVVRDLAPGSPDVPVAVMLPQDHGWMTPPYWRGTRTAWNYARIPYRPGERGIDGFFAAAFPGSSFAMDPFPFGSYRSDDPPASPFSLACVTPEFTPSPADAFNAAPPLPFGRFDNRKQAREQVLETWIDPSPYRPMSDSRWGDVFDVVLDDAPDSVLDKYKALLILGPVRLDGNCLHRLQGYVERGGQLLAAAGVFGPGHESLTGVAIEPEQRVGRAWRWGTEPFVQEPYRYVPCRVTSAGESTTVLARTQGGDPLILRRALGKGCVYSCLIPWFEAGHADLAAAALRLFDSAFAELQPVKVDGPPCQWVSTTGARGRFIAIANHDGAAWRGEISIQPVDDRVPACAELLTAIAVPCAAGNRGLTLSLNIPPYDVRVLHLGSVRE